MSNCKSSETYWTFWEVMPRNPSRCMQQINDILDHPKRQEIENRVRMLEFFGEYGAKPTRKAFGKSRSTIYLWKKKLRASVGKLSALALGDRVPHEKKGRRPCIESFIIGHRMSHPRVDKPLSFRYSGLSARKSSLSPLPNLP